MLSKADMDILVFKHFLSTPSSVLLTFIVAEKGSTKVIRNNRYEYFLYSTGGKVFTTQMGHGTKINVKSCISPKVDIDEAVASSIWLEHHA